MSGIEVVGLLLGAIPVVISAVSGYREGRSELAVWRKYGHLLKDLIRELQSQEIFFQNNIEILLKTAGVDEGDVTSFVQPGPLRGQWSATMQADVQEYLRKPSYGALCETLEGYKEVVTKIAGRMQQAPADFLPSGKSFEDILVEKKHANGTYEIKKRLKFVVSKREIGNMVEQLQKWNGHLSKICSDASKINQLNSTVPSRRAAKVAATLYGVRGQALRLFRAISSNWSSCHPCHEASMRLESRLEVDKNKPGRVSNFRLSLRENPAEPGKTTLWHEATVPTDDELDNNLKLVTPKNPTVVLVVPPPVLVVNDSAPELNDICGVISRANSEGLTVTLAVGPGSKLLLASEKMCSEDPSLRSERGPICLAVLLQGRRDPTNPYRRLTLAERTTLSVVLASSLLQLWGTPWLNRPCMKTSVHFPPPSLQSQIDVKHPFISVPYPAGSQEPAHCSLRICLLELGITLLELWHNKTMEMYYGHPPWDASAMSNDFYERLGLALRWLDETADDMVWRHTQAVRSCMKFCHVSTGGKDTLENTALRNEVYEGIVLPLLENARDGGS
ncbi:hypothetical protein FH972_023491 [Carpinus fangiana]|uniref:DUF7580 domain-containing protein n=1 Tax=Carpinus fangiana TaxID=176857 RepID=A0A5N6KVB7_9ROSI|nr:hypothetical protein FH972_023491 [Carpinus fangiana]